MLFKMKIDDEIDLMMPQPLIAKPLFDLIDSDREHLQRWLPLLKNVKSVDDEMAYIVQCLAEFGQQKSMNCALYYKGELAGSAGYNLISNELKKVKIGYWLGSKFTRKGIMHRAVEFLIAYAFDELGMEKVEILVAESNHASIKVVEGLGLVKEAVIGNCELLNDGTMARHICYAALRSDC